MDGGSPAPGQLARVRGRIWVVGDVARDSRASLDGRPAQHLVSLVSVEDDATGEELAVIWEIEPGTRVIDRAELPPIAADRLDDPVELDAFLDAVRWDAVTSADQRALQAPFRSERSRAAAQLYERFAREGLAAPRAGRR